LLPSGKISRQKKLPKRKLDGIFIIFESNPKIKSILTMVLVSPKVLYFSYPTKSNHFDYLIIFSGLVVIKIIFENNMF